MESIEKNKDLLINKLEEYLIELGIDREFEVEHIQFTPIQEIGQNCHYVTVCKKVQGTNGNWYISCGKKLICD